MNINTDINILGSITDYHLIINYIKAAENQNNTGAGFQSYSNVKTTKSFARYEAAINSTLLKYKSTAVEDLIKSVLKNEEISFISMLLLFWNVSYNNEFMHYLNGKVLFPAFYSGRIGIKKDEVVACIKDLRTKESALKKWTESTINVTATKYISFLAKVGLMKGKRDKIFSHHYVDDKLFVIFVYWLLAIETKPNVLKSQWLQYSLMEKNTFTERMIQNTFRKYFSFQYYGDNLRIEPILKYEELYDSLKQP